jgi:hypothetical protein
MLLLDDTRCLTLLHVSILYSEIELDHMSKKVALCLSVCYQ